MPLVGKPTSKQLTKKPKQEVGTEKIKGILSSPAIEKHGTNVNGIWTHLTIPGMVLGANYSEYTHARGRACIDLKECTRLYQAGSKNEKEGIQAFIRANSLRKQLLKEYWYLLEIRNLDTGRKILCAGYKFEPPGLTLEQIKKAVGLS